MIPHRAKIAITGATGLIGSALCRRFADSGFDVLALARRPELVPRRAPTTAARWDLRETLDPGALEGCEAVIHAAYAVRGRDLRDAALTNEAGARALLAASRSAGVRRLVFLSSMSAHAGANSGYALSKLRVESMLDPARDLVVRPGLVLAREGGLFSRMVATVRTRRVIPLPSGGGQPLQTVHIDDLCSCIFAAVDRALAGAITVASPEVVTLRELLRLVAQRLGRTPRFVPVPAAPVIAALRLAEAVGLSLPATSENLRGLLTLEALDTRPDLERLGVSLRPTAAALEDLLQ